MMIRRQKLTLFINTKESSTVFELKKKSLKVLQKFHRIIYV